MSGPLCFVLMPFGKKPDAAGTLIDFDAVYRDLIAPAIATRGCEPLRADEEMTGGIIHKPMFERLVLCEYAVADLTTANANVFYELGVRHARAAVRARCWCSAGRRGCRSTWRCCGRCRTPLARRRACRPRGRTRAGAGEAAAGRARRAGRRTARSSSSWTDYPRHQPPRRRTCSATQVRIAEDVKERLAAARKQGVDAVRRIETELAPLDGQERASSSTSSSPTAP